MNLTSHAWWEPGKDSENAIYFRTKGHRSNSLSQHLKLAGQKALMSGKLTCIRSKCTCAYTSNKPSHKTENIVSNWFYNRLFKRELCKSARSYIQAHLTAEPGENFFWSMNSMSYFSVLWTLTWMNCQMILLGLLKIQQLHMSLHLCLSNYVNWISPGVVTVEHTSF